MRIIEKDPDAVLDYFCEWGRWMQQGDSIAVSQWLVSPADPLLVKEQETTVGTRNYVWLSGGTPLGKVTVTNHIETAQGRKDDRSFVLYIRER